MQIHEARALVLEGSTSLPFAGRLTTTILACLYECMGSEHRLSWRVPCHHVCVCVHLHLCLLERLLATVLRGHCGASHAVLHCACLRCMLVTVSCVKRKASVPCAAASWPCMPCGLLCAVRQHGYIGVSLLVRMSAGLSAGASSKSVLLHAYLL